MKTKIANNQTILISTFGCMGKTTFAKKYPELALDIESIHYNYFYDKIHDNDETAKADKEKRRVNTDFPANYVADVVKNYGKYRFIFLTLSKEVLAELDTLGMKYTILYPNYSRTEKILEDARKRGNSEAFVEILRDILSTTEERDTLLHTFNHDKFEFLDDDMYVEDYIDREYEYGRPQ